jgi:protein ImuB
VKRRVEVLLCLLDVQGGDWSGEVLAEASRLAVEEGGRVWVDAAGLPAGRVARRIVERLGRCGVRVRCGLAAVPVTAGAAALQAEGGRVVEAAGDPRAFLAELPLEVLEPEERLLALLEGVGITTCGALAALERESVEVRFGPAAVESWRRARGEDRRRLFGPVPVEPHGASIDFVDYVVTDPEQLLFTTNALLAPICAALAERGAHARRMTLTLPLANGTVWQRTLRPARPTASRATWLRLARVLLERLTVPDAVAGAALRVETTEPAAAVQGDLFDAGLGTAASVESAVLRILESDAGAFVRPVPNADPRPERRAAHEPDPGALAVLHAEAGRAAGARRGAVPGAAGTAGPTGMAGADGAAAALTLQLLPVPRPVRVETVRRRDHDLPVRYHDRRWHAVATAAGPERVSGGRWEEAYAREYYRVVTDAGTLLWLYRDVAQDRWYLQGWWD